MKNLKVNRNSFSVATFDAQQAEEKTYWHDKTPEQRLKALEQTRQMIYGYDPDTARLQRVLEVVKRS